MSRLHAPALAVLLALPLLCGCTRSSHEPQAPQSSGKIKAFVSILPQAYFVERVGRERVDVSVLVQPGHSPATYEPTPQQMAQLSKAQVYFRIGVPFETSFVRKIAAACKRLNVVDTRRGIELRRMKQTHSHEEDRHHDRGDACGEHDAAAKDPHTWLDPLRAKTQAGTICEELRRLDPAHAADYAANLHALEADLDSVHAKIALVLAPQKGKKFYVFHPAFGYFGDRYGLEQEPIEIEGKHPSAQHLARLIDQARKDKVAVIFVQPEFSMRRAETIAQAIHGAVVRMDPLARDYLANLEDMATKLRDALQGQSR